MNIKKNLTGFMLLLLCCIFFTACSTDNGSGSGSGSGSGGGNDDDDESTVQIESITPPPDGIYYPDAYIDFIVTFNEAVTVDTDEGIPAIDLMIGSLSQQALYVSGSGTTELVFRYIVADSPDANDSDGIEVSEGSINLNDGIIQGTETAADVSLNLYSVSGLTNVLVDESTWTTMTDANFIYIPGGWDVDGDGTIETGFWMAKYEAKDAGSAADISGVTSLREFLSSNFYVYNPDTKMFDEVLCSDGTTGVHSGTTPESCRQHAYTTASASDLGQTVNKVEFVAAGAPMDSISAVQAAIAVNDSQITGGKTIILPTDKQWMHVVQLIINNGDNWTDGMVNDGGTLFNGNIDSGGSLEAGTDEDELLVTDLYRRIHIIENGIFAEDPSVAPDYYAYIWDISGNVEEFTRGFIAANETTGSNTGGDTFLTGDSGWEDLSTIYGTDNRDAPDWMLPILADDILLESAQLAGRYYEGASINGAQDLADIGYGGGYFSGFSTILRGNHYSSGYYSGVATIKLVKGPASYSFWSGFRAASDYQ